MASKPSSQDNQFTADAEAVRRLATSRKKIKPEELAEVSMCCFRRDSMVRRFCIRVVQHVWFDYIVVLCILVNCAILALNDPLDKKRTSLQNRILDGSELPFTIIFACEMLIKIIALGFMGKNSYMADRWNWMDFFVVSVGFISMAPGIENFSALRTFRVLRPLRTLSSIPGMRVIVQSMLASIPALFNVFVLCVFIFFIFGIIGVQLWNGVLRGHCAYLDPVTQEWQQTEKMCALPCSHQLTSSCTPTFGDSCGSIFVSSINQTTGDQVLLDLRTVCRSFDNPNYGYVGFDDIGMACLSIFTSITLEGWVDIMYNLNSTWGIPMFNALYFVLLIMFGSFFLLNLALAVIWEEYASAQEAEEKKQLQLQQEFRASRISFLQLEAAKKKDHQRLPQPHTEGTRTEVQNISEDDGINHVRMTHTINIQEADKDAKQGTTNSQHAHEVGSGDETATSSSHALAAAAERLITSKWFNVLIVALILANTLTLALEHYGMSSTFDYVLDIFNYAFTSIFGLEMILKLIGLGVKGYVRSRFNVFDGVIVIVSIVEIVLAATGSTSGNSGLSALRSLRLMRVFKLAHAWKDLRRLLETIARSVVDVANASVVLLIVMFIFCLLGMQMFGGEFDNNPAFEEKPRAHFDNLWWSFVTVFQILTGENWNEVLYNSMLATGVEAVVYFVLLNVVGNYIILNLFLAILLGNFDSVGESSESSEESPSEHVNGSAKVADGSVICDDMKTPGANSLPQQGSSESPAIESIERHATGQPILPMSTSSRSIKPLQPDATEPDELRYYSLFLFSPSNKFRLLCWRISSHRYFEWSVLLLIAVSSVLLAVDEPRVATCQHLPTSDPDNCVELASFLSVADTAITTFFIIEMCLKVVTKGFVLYSKTTYLRNGWNVLDFVIVVVSILSLLMGNSASQLKALRSLRALRALRPLRVVSRYPGLKLVVNSIFGALPKVRNVALVNALFFLIFAVVGVQNWMGSLSECNDSSIHTFQECRGMFNVTGTECSQLPTRAEAETCQQQIDGSPFYRLWVPPPFHFDDTLHGLLTVFEVAAGEMWPDIMYVAVDAVGKELPRERDASPAAALFFIMINVVCSFFMLEIFTGVIIDNYNKLKEVTQGSALLTHEQQMWVESMKLAYAATPARQLRRPAGDNNLRAWCFDIAASEKFELSVMGLIICNTLVMAMRHYGQSQAWDITLDALNLIFSILFALEAVVKLVAFNVKQYFAIGWNRFDFVLVVLSFVGIAVNLGQLATLLRVIRVARIFRLLRVSKGLQQLFRTLLFSLPSLVNVGAVLLLVYFIYAVVGMNIFAGVKHGEFLNEDANFDTFWVAMMTLFRMSTGESYNGIMHDCMIEAPFCDPETNCGYRDFAPIYFISFYMLTAFVLLNLLVAIILDNFGDTVEIAEGANVFVLRDEHMQQFRAVWAKYDPEATKFVRVNDMTKLVLEINYPLGLKNFPGVHHIRSLRKEARNLLSRCTIPEFHGRVHFHSVLQALVSAASNSDSTLPDVPILQDLHSQRQRILSAVEEASNYSLREHIAAEMLQSTFRAFKTRKIMRDLRRAVIAKQITRETLDRQNDSRFLNPETDGQQPG